MPQKSSTLFQRHFITNTNTRSFCCRTASCKGSGCHAAVDHNIQLPWFSSCQRNGDHWTHRLKGSVVWGDLVAQGHLVLTSIISRKRWEPKQELTWLGPWMKLFCGCETKVCSNFCWDDEGHASHVLCTWRTNFKILWPFLPAAFFPQLHLVSCD